MTGAQPREGTLALEAVLGTFLGKVTVSRGPASVAAGLCLLWCLRAIAWTFYLLVNPPPPTLLPDGTLYAPRLPTEEAAGSILGAGGLAWTFTKTLWQLQTAGRDLQAPLDEGQREAYRRWATPRPGNSTAPVALAGAAIAMAATPVWLVILLKGLGALASLGLLLGGAIPGVLLFRHARSKAAEPLPGGRVSPESA